MPSSSSSSQAIQPLVLQERITLPKSNQEAIIIYLNSPSRLNCFNRNVCIELSKIFINIAKEANENKNSNLVAVIFTSKGRSFCAGADLKDPPSPIEQSSDLTLKYNPIHHMSKISIPVIGAVKGHVITGGFELALNCDFLIADPTTIFQDTHTKFGLAPCWGLSQYLQRVVGTPNAKYISFTANKISVDDAYRMGFVTEISNDSLQRAIEVADDIGCNDRIMVQRYKQVIENGGKLSLGNGLKLERQIALAHYLQIMGGINDDDDVDDEIDDNDKNSNLQKAKDFITDKNRPRSKL